MLCFVLYSLSCRLFVVFVLRWCVCVFFSPSWDGFHLFAVGACFFFFPLPVMCMYVYGVKQGRGGGDWW